MSGSALTTLKIRFDLELGDPVLFNQYQRQYNSYFRTFYNALVDNPKLKYSELPELVRGYYPENNLMDSYLINSAFQDAQSVYERFNTSKVKSGQEPLGHKLVFGSKRLFARRAKGLISKEEFQEQRLRPLYAIGESNYFSNRRFRIRDFKHIDFIVNKKVLFTFKLRDRRLRILNDLKDFQDRKEIPITYKVNSKNIMITFDKVKLSKEIQDLKPERHLSIDLNPGFIGLTVFDSLDNINVKLIDSKVFDLSEVINKHKGSNSASDSDVSKFFNSKRKFELKEINKQIFKLAEHYKTQYIDIENLDFKHPKGRICNNLWNKKLTIQSLESRSKCSGIHLLKVNPAFTSIVGNILNDYNIPDMCRSALEIGKRTLTGMNLNSFNRKGVDSKSHLDQSDFEKVKAFVTESMEERGYKGKIQDFKDISSCINQYKIKFRKPISECDQTVCNLKSRKSLIKVRTFRDFKLAESDSKEE